MARKSAATFNAGRTSDRRAAATAVAAATVEGVRARVNAQMKSDVVGMASDDRFKLSRIPTGVPAIDRLMLGGLARGRHSEIYGDWTAGKSLLLYYTLVRAQERGEVCAIVDGEGVFNGRWFRELGGDPDALLGYTPKTANELGNVLQLFVQNDAEVRGVDIVGIDSVASLLPEEELHHDFQQGDARVASLARLMSLLLRKVTSQNDKTAFIWTNQWRDKISRIPGMKSTPGGRALGFYASTRIEMMRTEKENEERETIHKGKRVKRKLTVGQWVTCTLKKEKTGARPESSAMLMLDYDTRKFDLGRQIIDLGMTDGLIDRVGDYFTLTQSNGAKSKRYHGINQVVKALDEDDDTREFLLLCIEEQTAILAAEVEGDG